MNKNKMGILAGVAGVILLIVLVAFVYSKGDHSGPAVTLVTDYEANYGEKIGLYDVVRAVSDDSEYTIRISAGGQVAADGRSTMFQKAGSETVEITAEDEHGNKTVKNATVKVTDAKPPVIYAKNMVIALGDPVDYRTGVTAEDEMDGNLTGNISVDTSKVDETRAGIYPVLYTVEDKAGNQATLCAALTIRSPEASGISLSRQSVALDGNGHYQLTADVEPRSWSGKINWETSNSDVAVVSDGLVTWTGTGSCVISATAGAVTTECQVECGYVTVSSIYIDRGKLELEYMGSEELETYIIPSNWRGEVVWTSSDTTVATVSDGVVTWQGQGECVITATADGRNSSCTVTCKEPTIESVNITEEALHLDAGQNYLIEPEIIPADWPGELVWTSSNPEIASVSDGVVRWNGAGTCTITVTAGELSDSVEVTCEQSFLDGLLDGLTGGEEQNPPDNHH